MSCLFDTFVLSTVDSVIVVFQYVSRLPVCTLSSDAYRSSTKPSLYGSFVFTLGSISGLG